MIRKYPRAAMLAMLLPLGSAAFLLFACSSAETDPGPGGVNAGDAKALDEASAKLDARQTNPAGGEPKG